MVRLRNKRLIAAGILLLALCAIGYWIVTGTTRVQPSIMYVTKLTETNDASNGTWSVRWCVDWVPPKGITSYKIYTKNLDGGVRESTIPRPPYEITIASGGRESDEIRKSSKSMQIALASSTLSVQIVPMHNREPQMNLASSWLTVGE